MKKIQKLVIASILTLGSCVFAENWQICVGSFKNRVNADALEKTLNSRGYEVEISEYAKSDKEKYFRVVFSENFKSWNEADKKRFELRKNLELKKLGVSELWCAEIKKPEPVKVEEKKPEPAKIEEPEEPVEVEEVVIERFVEIEKKVPVPTPVEVVKEVVKEVPVEVVKEVVKEVKVEVVKEVPVEKIIETVREVPVERPAETPAEAESATDSRKKK